MKNAERSLNDLRIVLSAIRQARARWLDILQVKVLEIQEENPGTDPQKAFTAAIGTEAVQEAFQALITLYGALGGQAEEFEAALNHGAQVVEMPLKQSNERKLKAA